MVDDIHLANTSASRRTLARFVEHPPAGLRLVLAGRAAPPWA